MALHRLTGITIGVPNVEQTAAYYDDFGLQPLHDHLAEPAGPDTGGAARFATTDGGEQLRIVETPRRRLVSLGIGVDDDDDLGRIASALQARSHPFDRSASELVTEAPAAGIVVHLSVAPRIEQKPAPWPATNGPGRTGRADERAEGVQREGRVRPRKLGHVVIGSTDQSTTRDFFIEAIGLKVSDEVPGLASFLRCSTDHHNLLVQSAPIDFLHHTAWQVDDVDEVGRGASAMIGADPRRHAWGLGRHHIGSNFFWYLRDPAGNFSEYYSDLDCIVDDELWEPAVFTGPKGLYNWGPQPPSDFVEPSDIAAMVAAQSM